MQAFKNPAGGEEPGLIQLVEKARDQKTPAMTLEEFQRHGGVDPVGVKIDKDSSLSLKKPTDGPAITKIMKKLKIDDDTITDLVGLRPTDRDRAM